MNVDKKLQVFTEITMREVEEKRRQVRKELDDAFTGAVEEASRVAERRAQERVRQEQYKIDRLNNIKVTETATEERRAQKALRERLANALIDDVVADLRAYAGSQAYQTALADQIQAAQRASDGAYRFVQVTEADLAVVHSVAAAAGLTAEPELAADDIGGFRLVTADRRVMDDRTLRNRLDEARRAFTYEFTYKD